MRKILICILGLVVSAPEYVFGQFVNNNGITLVNSATVMTNGDWQNNGAITNNGRIVTSENWVNSGTLNNSSRGGFELNYSSDKSFAPGGTTFGFLTKKGAGSAVVTGNFTLIDSASLRQGIVSLSGGANAITFGNGGIFVLKHFSGSWVEGGTLSRRGTGDLLFPVGRSSQYLPVRFYGVTGTSPNVSVTVEEAPAGYTAGGGIKDVVAFPFVWKTRKANPSDSARYVEIEYPDALPVPATPVVANKSGAAAYESLGQKTVSTVNNRVTVRSYTGALQQVFTIANGYPKDVENDSLALVALFNASNGAAWTNKGNWLTNGTLMRSWFGITQKGHSITEINLPGNKLTGSVPGEITGIESLVKVDLSRNELETIPVLSGIPALKNLNVSENKLGFASLIDNVGVLSLNYAEQKLIGQPLYQLVDVGGDFVIPSPDKTTGNVYVWSRNTVPVNGATAEDYGITNIRRNNMGTYEVQITNPLVPGLVLKSHPQVVLATATLSGRLFATSTDGATSGKVTLFRITPEGAYDTTALRSVASDGAFLIDKVILDDYQLMGFADTLVYKKALPTYYEGSIFWEEATTLALDENRTNLDIFTIYKPDPLKDGVGEIVGTLIADEEISGGRTQGKKPVKKAGAAVRREQSSGRTDETLYELVAHTFTNDQGEFTFSNLDPGVYWLNLQYPGYPMDSTTYIQVTVGNTLRERSVFLEADIVDNKIAVRQLIILGWEDQETKISVYPNPTNSLLFFDAASKNPDLVFEIVDMTGRTQKIAPVYDSEKRRWVVDVSALTRGNYAVKLVEKNAVRSLRFIIE